MLSSVARQQSDRRDQYEVVLVCTTTKREIRCNASIRVKIIAVKKQNSLLIVPT
jgi:DNA-directed RNA polymerase subunit E'/Rpb7